MKNIEYTFSQLGKVTSSFPLKKVKFCLGLFCYNYLNTPGIIIQLKNAKFVLIENQIVGQKSLS